MTQFNRFPTYQENLAEKGVTTRGWYTFWSGLFKGQPTGPIAPIAVTASPFTYTATQGGSVLIQGGTVSLVQISRDGTTNFATGATQGPFPVSQGDLLIVNYTVAPNMTFIPR